MKVKIGIVGYGSFSKNFVKLFRMHPDVEEVAVAELMEERRKEVHEKYPDMRIFNSLDDLLERGNDINCVGIFTQRHLHAPMVIQALKAGKHVYSAVPIACTVEEVREIVEIVKETRQIYMMGETCYYYPAAIFCREKNKEGAFGKFVYAEAQYYHDIREMYDNFSHSGGENWRRVAGIPPMFYPTHSISMVFPAINAHAVKVSCVGMRDDFPDDIYGEEKNDFQNPFSNESALFQMSDGSTVRINEFRRVGINKPSTYITAFYGEQAAYDCVADQHLFQSHLTSRAMEKNPNVIWNTYRICSCRSTISNSSRVNLRNIDTKPGTITTAPSAFWRSRAMQRSKTFPVCPNATARSTAAHISIRIPSLWMTSSAR